MRGGRAKGELQFSTKYYSPPNFQMHVVTLHFGKIWKRFKIKFFQDYDVTRRRSTVSCVDVYEYSLESGDMVKQNLFIWFTNYVKPLRKGGVLCNWTSIWELTSFEELLKTHFLLLFSCFQLKKDKKDVKLLTRRKKSGKANKNCFDQLLSALCTQYLKARQNTSLTLALSIFFGNKHGLVKQHKDAVYCVAIFIKEVSNFIRDMHTQMVNL